MKALAILLLSLIIVSDIKANYSIESFIKHLQEKGYYNILIEIAFYFGKDIAIALCKEFIKSSDCETLVRIYFPSRSNGENTEIKTLESIIFNPANYDTYKNHELEIHNSIEKIKNEFNIP